MQERTSRSEASVDVRKIGRISKSGKPRRMESKSRSEASVAARKVSRKRKLVKPSIVESESCSEASVVTREILRISKSVKPGRMAQIINKQLVKKHYEVVYGRMRGTDAALVAIQSVIIANLELEKIQSQLSAEYVGKVMVFVPEATFVWEEGQKKKMWEMHFQLVGFGKVPSAGSGKEDLVVTKTTKAGKLAGAMLAYVSQHSKAVLRFFGHQALGLSIAATTIAQDMLDQDESESGNLAIYPDWHNGREQQYKGIELRCFKL